MSHLRQATASFIKASTCTLYSRLSKITTRDSLPKKRVRSIGFAKYASNSHAGYLFRLTNHLAVLPSLEFRLFGILCGQISMRSGNEMDNFRP